MRLTAIILLSSLTVFGQQRICDSHPEYCKGKVVGLSVSEKKQMDEAQSKYEASMKAYDDALAERYHLFSRIVKAHGLDKYPILADDPFREVAGAN